MYREVVRFLQFRRTDQTADKYIAEYDLLRREAESEMEMGAGFPEPFASILRMQNAGHPRQEELLALASSQKILKFADAVANMRRLFGSYGGRPAKTSWFRRMRTGFLEAIEIRRHA